MASELNINFDAARNALSMFVDDAELWPTGRRPSAQAGPAVVQAQTALELGESEVNAGNFENAKNTLTKLIDDLQKRRERFPQIRKIPEPNTINPFQALDGLINPITNLRDQVAAGARRAEEEEARDRRRDAVALDAANTATGVVGGRKRKTRKRKTRKRKTRKRKTRKRNTRKKN